MRKTGFIAVAILVLCTGFAVAGGTHEAQGTASSSKPVQITFLNSKGEITAQLQTLFQNFTKDNPSITVNLTAAGAGVNPFQQLMTMYASGNAPAVAMVDASDLPKLAPKFLDLSGQKWVSDAVPGSLALGTINGTLVGFPFTIEGYGLIYNKAVLDKAYGGSFDPSSIRTINDLKTAFEKVQAIGVAPVVITPLNWSLGSHYLGIAAGDQSSDPAKVAQFIADLKAGKVNLANNQVYNGLMESLQLMAKYNLGKADPMAVTYAQGPEYLAKGQAGFWFMGTWAWPQIAEFNTSKASYGFVPVPISNNPSDYGNTQIPAGPTKYLGLDKTQNSPAQQAAAEKLLNWMVYNPTAQKELIDSAGIVMAFKNVTLPSPNDLNRSMQAYITAGKASEFAANLFPPDHWEVLGAPMQEFFVGKITKAQLFKTIEDYWIKVGQREKS